MLSFETVKTSLGFQKSTPCTASLCFDKTFKGSSLYRKSHILASQPLPPNPLCPVTKIFESYWFTSMQVAKLAPERIKRDALPFSRTSHNLIVKSSELYKNVFSEFHLMQVTTFLSMLWVHMSRTSCMSYKLVTKSLPPLARRFALM